MSFFEIIKALLPLFVIVLLLYGVLLFVRKYNFKIKSSTLSNIKIRVLSSQLIMPKKYITVVQIQNKMFVLGVSENSITLLKELEETVPEDKMPINEEQNKFIDILRKNLGK